MSRCLFISDIHLSPDRPDITAVFLSFLRTEARQCDALYLLGDLFDFWIGDDYSTLLYQKIAKALKCLPAKKFFIHGNRDFLIGHKFARDCNIVILPNEEVLTLYGKRILIMHGDTLCTHDKNYLVFKSKINETWFQKLFLALPLYLRKYIALRIRINSKMTYQYSGIIDVNINTVKDIMLQHKVNILIHGHTHDHSIYNFNLQGEQAKRAVLGDWYNQGSIIQVDSDGICLFYFSLLSN